MIGHGMTDQSIDQVRVIQQKLAIVKMYCTRGNMSQGAVFAVSPPLKKFTPNEWHLTHDQLVKSCFDTQKNSDLILRESDLLANMVFERTKSLKAESDHQSKVRVQDLEFYRGEIEKIRKELISEIECVVTYIDRLADARTSIEDALDICKKCLVLRDRRTGIDLVHDDVQNSLLQELQVISGVQEMFKRLDGQMGEQLRHLRALMYALDRNLEDKIHALRIEERNASLDTKSIDLFTYHGTCPLASSNITFEEWADHTRDAIESSLNKLASSRQLRVVMEQLMRQAVEDLIAQRTVVNAAFHRKLSEVKEMKSFLEERHSDITRKCQEMMENIRRIQQAIKDQEPYMALSHTRLGNRAHRRNVELVKDRAETELANEVLELRGSVARLQHLLVDSKASLRQLLKSQLSLEEQINVKTVSIKVDEVECLTIRQKMDYFNY